MLITPLSTENVNQEFKSINKIAVKSEYNENIINKLFFLIIEN